MSFDRAASYYDETRSLPPEAAAQVTTLLTNELASRDKVLEPGVGTGRIALPLHANGIPIVGIDLARSMLDVLRRKPGGSTFPLAQGDITRMPFADQTFDAAVVSHIFHLVPDTEAAASELLRVLRPGGRVLLATHTNAETGWRLAIREALQSTTPNTQLLTQDERRDRAESLLSAQAADKRELEPIVVRRDVSINEYVDRLSSGQWSWSWGMSEQQLKDSAQRTRKWAESEFGSLDEQRNADAEVTWTAFDLP